LDSSNKIKEIAISTINQEAKAIKKLSDYIDNDFIEATKSILKSSGRVVITGIGKSANIASKIVATLNSTGTPAMFMHAADAIHGDLGMIRTDDIIICISKSGNTPEIKVLVPLIKKMGNLLIALVSNTDSLLAKQAKFVLNAHVEKEACPNNLAPTNSTTAQLVIGDALAVSLLHSRDFSSQDFAKFHPGGALGKKLYLQTEDVAITENPPKVNTKDNIRNIILEISSKRMGSTAVVDHEDNLVGIITDGDLRRMLENKNDISELSAEDIMSKNPKTIETNTLAIEAFNIMEKHNITQLILLSKNKYLGMVHLHDLLKEGIV